MESISGKTVSESTRASWVKEVCEAAIKYMMDVRQTFQNYTLHDGTHIINVLDAMGGVLGNQVSQLTGLGVSGSKRCRSFGVRLCRESSMHGKSPCAVM